MKNTIKHITIAIVSLSLMLTALTSCGKLGHNELYLRAKSKYGDCSVESCITIDGTIRVILTDKLQGFQYEIWSYDAEINIDGSSIGTVASVSDNFVESLKSYVLSSTKADLDKIAADTGTSYETEPIYSDDILLVIRAEDAETGKKAAKTMAAELNNYNKRHRLDDMQIIVSKDDAEYYWDAEHFGSVLLPSTVFRTPELEKIDYFVEMAHLQTDPEAAFLRVEEGTFADTGASLDRIVNILGSEQPTSMESPVKFYFFRAPNGYEYYICDFNYYKEESNQFAWYTSYGK